MTDVELQKMRLKANEELKKIPGVRGVGYGFKLKNGELTKEIGWRVYVDEKLQLDDIAEENVIPVEFGGIAIDVIQTTDGALGTCGDNVVHDPPLGGITIYNTEAGLNQAGTLGCMASINGETSRDRYALLTNHHVLRGIPNLLHLNQNARPGGLVGDSVYSVAVTNIGGNQAVSMDGANSIATINNMGRIGPVPYTYPPLLEEQYFIDCASAKIDSCFSSWCDTNCAQGLDARIRGLNLPLQPDNFISGVRALTAADVGTVVYKVGRTTGRTRGIITDPNYMGLNVLQALQVADNVIEISYADSICASTTGFFLPGDSGSVLVTEQGDVVGLMFYYAPGGNLAYACHIDPVLQELNLTLLTSNANLGSPGSALKNAPGKLSSSNNNPHFRRLKQRFEEHPAGTEMFKLVEVHRAEISELVNFCRPVTVVWHRSKGPAFLGHFINSSRTPDHIIPQEIEGVTLAQCLRNMADTLMEHGSDALKEVVSEQWQTAVLIGSQITKIEEFFTLINRDPAL